MQLCTRSLRAVTVLPIRALIGIWVLICVRAPLGFASGRVARAAGRGRAGDGLRATRADEGFRGGAHHRTNSELAAGRRALCANRRAGGTIGAWAEPAYPLLPGGTRGRRQCTLTTDDHAFIARAAGRGRAGDGLSATSPDERLRGGAQDRLDGQLAASNRAPRSG